MTNKQLKYISLFLLSAINLIVCYVSQSPYLWLSKELPTSQNAPALDPMYTLANKNWHHGNIEVNLSQLAPKVQNMVQTNIEALSMPITLTNTVPQTIAIQKTPLGTHALTTNNGLKIKIDPTYMRQMHNHPKALAQTVTHELGHTLGLLHTNTPTLMYPVNNADQHPILNDAQKMYIYNLGFKTPITHAVARMSAPMWTANAVNNTQEKTIVSSSGLHLFTMKGLPSAKINTLLIVMANFIPIEFLLILLISIIFKNKKD